MDVTNRGLDQAVGGVNDVLREAAPSVRRAMDQLGHKTSVDTSRNAFLVIHPFDHVTAECLTEYVIGPYLDPLEDVGDLDTVWVLWAPDHLTVWSDDGHEWINLLFDVLNPDEAAERSQKPSLLAILQEAEQYFFTRTGYTDGSPYLFKASYR